MCDKAQCIPIVLSKAIVVTDDDDNENDDNDAKNFFSFQPKVVISKYLLSCTYCTYYENNKGNANTNQNKMH